MSQDIKPLQVFRSGRFTAMNGQDYAFSETDLQASADAYDPAVSEAPLVVGHPKVDAPAYGWVRRLAFADAALQAEPHQVNADFAEMVNSGAFKKMSASWYHPQAKNNPVPGVWYLRHIGFLGAQPPAVKGLQDASFAADEDGVITVEFGEGVNEHLFARFIRRMREFLIDKFGTETADQVVPDYFAEEAEASARAPAQAEPAFSEAPIPYKPRQEESTVDPDKQKAEFAERQQQLADQESALAQREARIKAAEEKARREEIAAFCETLVEKGQLLPKDKPALVEFMASQDAETQIEFSEGDSTVKKPGADWLRGFLEAMPPRVDFGEHARTDDEDAADVSFAAPAGYTVNQERLAIHQKALGYQNQHNVDYITAVQAVSK